LEVKKKKKINKDQNLPRNESPSAKALTRPFIYRPNPRQYAGTKSRSWWGKGKHKDKRVVVVYCREEDTTLDHWSTCEN
jgi:hypothetical protein